MRLMKPIYLAVVFLLVPSLVNPGQLEGKWRLVSQRLNVKVLNWGDDCGPLPKSHSSMKVRHVFISDQGGQVRISGGGEAFSTKECWSQNVRLRIRNSKHEANRWVTVCETPKDESRYERGMYELSVIGLDRIEYRAESYYDWRLKGDHCEARLVENRLYLRPMTADELSSESGDTAPQPEPAVKKEIPAPEPEDTGTKVEFDECPEHEEPVKIMIRPRSHSLSPGGKLCLKAYGIDKNGCRFPVEPKWQAFNRGNAAPERFRGNCFIAGDTAAEGEGVFRITALYEGLKARSSINVRFPNIADLVAARIDPRSEFEKQEKGKSADEPSASAQPAAVQDVPAVPLPAASADSSSHDWKYWLMLAGIAVVILLAAVALVFIILMQRHRKQAMQDQILDNDAEVQVDQAEGFGKTVVCPTCERELPAGSKFCPHDGTMLGSKVGDKSRRGGREDKICPRCHRRFKWNKVVCPHDGAELLSYQTWLAKHGPQSGGGKGKGKICPLCATKYDNSATFCGKDGSTLVTLN